MPRPGWVPSAGRRTRNGFCGGSRSGERRATSRWRRRRRICTGAAVCTPARSGASPCWDARSSGGQSGTACPAAGDAPPVRSSTAPATGSRNGCSHTGPCRGGHSSSGCMRDDEAMTTRMAGAGTPARCTASSIGRWTVRSHGSIGGAASGGVLRGSRLPTCATASRERVRV
jgi:hypothetical protein